MTRKLELLFDDVARRARATEQAHPTWPCRAGCDTCCRRLADVPRVSEAEWRLLEDGLGALPPDVRARVVSELDALAERPPGEGELVTCPMLDRDRGLCLVYEHRPAACRAYGYYARRDDVLACDRVTTAVAEQAEQGRDDVVWGNHAALDDDLARACGEARPITAFWLETRGRT